jgi:hypothetical protein
VKQAARAAAIAICLLSWACSGSSAPSDGSTDAGAGGDASGGRGGDGAGGTAAGGRGGSGGASGGGGSALCGARACTSGELCVHPSCGGAPLPCNPVPDGGECPAGWIMRAFCPSTGGAGCEPPPCTPPTSYCLTPPASCGATPSCSCLPANVCQGGGSCSIISRGEVLCVSA